MNTNDK